MCGICANFNKPPEICFKKGFFNREEKFDFTFLIIFLSVLFVVANVIVFILCRKYMKRRLNERLDSSDLIAR